MSFELTSGVNDQYIYFVAVDATDLKTRETGLSGFTVYRSRNGGASAVYTTPTINETDSTNMPGVYELLVDEDVTIDSGDDTQEICLHITHASMAPVTRVITLKRPKLTAGETLTVTSGRGNADVTHIATAAVNTSSAQLGVNVVNAGGVAWASGAITAAVIATDAVDADAIADNAISAGSISAGAITSTKFAAGALDAVWSTATRVLTAGTNIVLAKGTGITGFNDLDAAGIRSAVGLALANLDSQLSSIVTDTGTDIPALINALNDLDAAGVRSAVGLTVANLDAQLATIAGYIDTEIAAILAAVDTEIGAIKAKTDNLPVDPASASSIAALNDISVADILAGAIEGSITVQQSLRLANSALGGKASGLETTNALYRDLGDTKNRINATVDANGNRTAIILDLA